MNRSCANATFGSVVVIETAGLLILVMLSLSWRPVSSEQVEVRRVGLVRVDDERRSAASVR